MVVLRCLSVHRRNRKKEEKYFLISLADVFGADPPGVAGQLQLIKLEFDFCLLLHLTTHRSHLSDCFESISRAVLCVFSPPKVAGKFTSGSN